MPMHRQSQPPPFAISAAGLGLPFVFKLPQLLSYLLHSPSTSLHSYSCTPRIHPCNVTLSAFPAIDPHTLGRHIALPQ
eukprot:4757550-Amphidinium_carterae.1